MAIGRISDTLMHTPLHTGGLKTTDIYILILRKISLKKLQAKIKN
ncbi:hypothetical protein J577_1261 [Acinetobacter sp. 263903-1]|uniref:Uncharacterized protein n=1 Tax=Acinetobacter radioresistens SK82 TaxID=596318 RepID=A0ABP2GJ87_ACIRA|nr:hypothetical protein ACIRA0001_0633 [Acinetobacter radioresistens SK82]EJO34854.1 hypothetical protein ACINWCA157_0456 [Acinetobacter radioresistens WC-A-157]EXB34320.1 hypothetical protein J546_1103 [Acinetobacter sp. 1461402]EXB72538.1 hypothetical protein J550_1455 [Acinetobacter sp. 230853]EXB87246.1 hypothetical protein J538_0740 [Acinetobacter sp. 272263]EXC31522.1 hypothetical protein J520_2141 [Acinetobacter sp. 869535]EXE13343.1 hypothetical protein J559_2513 [Acinetobacter sp. 98